MANQESHLPNDKYSGMRDLNFAITPNVLICGAAGTVLGLILAVWGAGADSTGIVVATSVVMGILSGIFGMFV